MLAAPQPNATLEGLAYDSTDDMFKEIFDYMNTLKCKLDVTEMNIKNESDLKTEYDKYNQMLDNFVGYLKQCPETTRIHNIFR